MKKSKVIEEDRSQELEEFRKKFKVIAGGKGPNEPTGVWLKDIPEGHMFFTCQRGQTPSMFCQVLQHFDQTTVCFDVLNQVKFVVHTTRFSNGHEKLQVIPIYPKEEGWVNDDIEEQENGKSDKLHGNEEGSSRVVVDPRDDKA